MVDGYWSFMRETVGVSMKRMRLSKLPLVDPCFNTGWFGFFKGENKVSEQK